MTAEFDPFAVAVIIGLLGAVVAGPVMAVGLDLLPQRWRRTAAWLLIGIAVVLAGFLANAPVRGRLLYAYVYVLAALPGLVAYLAFRTLLASALVSLAPLYFVIGELTRNQPAYVPEISLDRSFSLQPAWMFAYGSLYVFALLMPLLVIREQGLFRRAMQAYLAVMIFSYVGFLLFPTVAPRPAEVPGNDFFAWSLRLAYSIDPPHGCFPSLHVAYSFVAALACYRVHSGVGVVAGLWAMLIGVSTLFTKQHYIVDVIAGALAAYVAYVLFLRSHPREAIPESDRRRAPLAALAAFGVFAVMVAGFWMAYRMGVAVA